MKDPKFDLHIPSGSQNLRDEFSVIEKFDDVNLVFCESLMKCFYSSALLIHNVLYSNFRFLHQTILLILASWFVAIGVLERVFVIIFDDQILARS